MGQGQLLAAGTAALIAAAALPGQGPIYRERWGDLHLELLRERVLRESAGRDQATLARIAELLAGPDQGVPFRPAAQALAALRGRPCDDAFLFRATVGSFVLPEVVDPEAANETCRNLHVSLFLPFAVPAAGVASFDLEATDGGGARVFAATIAVDTAVDDLRMARTRAEVPAAELPDGAYRLVVRTRLDGEGPRDWDPVLAHGFHVLRGYQARAEAARARAAAVQPSLPSLSRALLEGLVLEVNRAYAGEAFDGTSEAALDLRRLEQALDNVAAGRPPLHGMQGLVPAALPAGGDCVLGAVVSMPADARPRPLLVFAGGAPAYDLTMRRPAAPSVRSGRWLQRRLGGLGLDDVGHLAWLQSPGAGIPYAKALPVALAALRELLPTDGRTVLVLELEAAMAATLGTDLLGREATAAVLVGAGTLSAPALRSLGDLRILGVPLTGHPSGAALQFSADVAAGRHGAVDWSARFELAKARPRPWTFGAAAARDEIADFVRAALAAR